MISPDDPIRWLEHARSAPFLPFSRAEQQELDLRLLGFTLDGAGNHTAFGAFGTSGTWVVRTGASAPLTKEEGKNMLGPFAHGLAV